MATYQPSTPPFYLSSASANALISDFQPTSITPPTLHHINLFLDELLFSLISAANSLNPTEIRSAGVPAVFSADKSGESTAIRSLGRSAVGEAELELRSWTESHGSVRLGFGKDGNGMKRGGGFMVQEAYGVMRGKCEEFSTLAGEEQSDQVESIERMNAWISAGGNGDDNVLHPAALYITAILEHVCEHVLQSLARVVGRDSDNTTASLEDLFTAVAEDDGIWGFFKRMQIRITLEEAIKARQKRSHPSRQIDRFGNRPSPESQTSLVHSSSSGAIRDQEKKSSLPPSYERQSTDTSRSGAVVSGSNAYRTSPSNQSTTTSRFGPGIGSRETHNRTPSVLSASTRNMIGAYNDQSESGGRSRRDEEDDFDALVASGETMKVSLTPSRLKNFDAGRRVASGASNQSSLSRRDRPADPSPPRSDELPPLLPRSAQRGVETSQQPPRTTSMLSRTGSNSALGTQGKLQPRSAAIVAEEEQETEELTDELDSPFKHRKKQAEKESLAELLASTGPVPDAAFESDGGNVKRTVPAVILGSAPPTFYDSPTPATGPIVGSVNRPARRVNASTGEKKTPAREMADFFDDGPPSRQNQSKPKTPAQEMADFFDSTPPPSATPAGRYGSPIENVVAPPPKKGLRGLISKISGRRGSEETPSGISSTSLTSKEYKAQIKAETQGQEAKRQKSLASIPTMTTTTLTPGQLGAGERRGSSAKSIAEAYRAKQQQSSPPIPEIPILAPSLPTSSTSPTSTPKILQEPAMPRSTSGSSLTAGAGGLTRKTSNRKPVPYASAGNSPEALSSPVIPSAVLVNPQTPPLSSAMTRRKPSTVDEDITSDADEEDGKTLEGKKSNDQLSFATARETPMTPGVMDDGAHKGLGGEDTTPKVVQGALVGGVAGVGMGMLADKGVDTVREAAGLKGGGESSEVNKPTEEEEKLDSVPEASTIKDVTPPAAKEESIPSTSIPSIPLVDIVPLRHLLDGATSVKECQLLLSATLSQWGVPLSSPSNENDVNPESRIAAWLLAGRDGPVGDIKLVRGGDKDGVESKAREERLSSEGTAVEKDEGEGPTIGGVVEDIKELAVAGINKVF